VTLALGICAVVFVTKNVTSQLSMSAGSAAGQVQGASDIEGRITAARHEKDKAADRYQGIIDAAAALQTQIRDMLYEAQIKADEQSRKIGIVQRRREAVLAERKFSRSVADLKARVAAGTLDAGSLQLSMLRMIKSDEQVALIDRELAKLDAFNRTALAHYRFLKALSENLKGRSATIPLPVPPELKAVAVQAAEVLAKIQSSRRSLDDAGRTLEIFVDKRLQIKQDSSGAKSVPAKS
jgi:Xaa-Pro aminopeptidase